MSVSNKQSMEFNFKIRLLGFYHFPNQDMKPETERVEEAKELARLINASVGSLMKNPDTDKELKEIIKDGAVFIFKDEKSNLYGFFTKNRTARITGVKFSKGAILQVPLKYKAWFYPGRPIRLIIPKEESDQEDPSTTQKNDSNNNMDSKTKIPATEVNVKALESVFDKRYITAVKKCKEREFNRLKIGEHVNLDSCQQSSEFHDKIEFYKDGGWGIAEKDGTVIIPNHIIGKPSKQRRYIKSSLKKFVIIQDRDTKLYGVLSIEDSIKEVLHCIYNHIEIIEQQGNEKKSFYIKVQIGEQWGFFNEDFALIVNIQYGSIEIRDKYIEGNRDGRQYDEENEWGQYHSFYDGKKDLYDLYGNFLLGGYDFLDIDSKGYLLFYWHALLEEYTKTMTGLWDDKYDLTCYRRNFDDAICLILDDQFKPISGENYTLRGLIKRPLDEAYYPIPDETLFMHETHIDSNDQLKLPIFEFLGCKIKNEDEYYFYVKQIVKNADEFYFPDRYLEWYNFYSTGNNMNIKKIDYKGAIVKDDQIVLSSYSQERELLWRALVNELGITNSHAKIYRIGCKCGFYNSEHINEAKYDAISLNSTNEHIYVAIVESLNESNKLDDSNSNVFPEVGLRICYYEVLEDVLELLPDNWDAFNPTKHQWFPSNFIMNKFESRYDGRDWKGADDYEDGGITGWEDYTIEDSLYDALDGKMDAIWNID